MTKARMKLALAERKKTIYAAVVAVFLALCSAYIWRTLSVTEEAAGSFMREWVVRVRESLNKTVSSDIRKDNAFTRSLLADLPVAGDYFAFFDASGEVVASVAKPENGEDREMQEELRAGVAGFLQSGENHLFKRRNWRLCFDNYLLLDKDAGLVLGARVPAARFLPFFDGMMQFFLMVFFIISFLIALIIVLDVVNDRERARELHKISHLDLLTGLLNELGMQVAVKGILARGPVDNNSFICFDLVNFHRFNAMFGYTAGDKALRAIADVLRDNYSYGARISSDVFACLGQSSPDIFENLNQRLREAIKNGFGSEYIDSLSFKYGVYPMQGTAHTVGEVYDGALLALKHAKKTPKRLGYIYDAELRRQAKLHRKIEMYMLHALSKGEFQLYVQPKFDIARQRCCGGEVLVRWQSDDIGLVMPSDFIPLFEKNGFIVELDFYILSTVFRNLREELDLGREPARLSINQSRATIVFPNYLMRLENIIKQYDVPTRYVQLEITESFLEHDYGVVVSLMHKLKEFGFSIAMDDFGTGYSSLNTLRELPVDTLKIDKEFLSESDNSARSRTIIRNIINMSHELGVDVVCEGVETERQLRFLAEAGCDVIQGFYYSKPVVYKEYVEKYFPGRSRQERALRSKQQ